MSDLVKRLQYQAGCKDPDLHKADVDLLWEAADWIEELENSVRNGDTLMARDEKRIKELTNGLENALYMLGVIDLDGNISDLAQDNDPDAIKPGVRRALNAYLGKADE